MALVKLGRKAEAGADDRAALLRDPENALTHANQGWALLEQGDHGKALEHFREALRIDPEIEWARAGDRRGPQGAAPPLPADAPLFPLDGEAEPAGAVGVILGFVFGRAILGALRRVNPRCWRPSRPAVGRSARLPVPDLDRRPALQPLAPAQPVRSLRASREQVTASNWVGLCALGFLLGDLVSDESGGSAFAPLTDLGMIYFGLLIHPTPATFTLAGLASDGDGRVCVVLAVMGLCGPAAPVLGPVVGEDTISHMQSMFLIGIILSTWIGAFGAQGR